MNKSGRKNRDEQIGMNKSSRTNRIQPDPLETAHPLPYNGPTTFSVCLVHPVPLRFIQDYLFISAWTVLLVCGIVVTPLPGTSDLCRHFQPQPFFSIADQCHIQIQCADICVHNVRSHAEVKHVFRLSQRVRDTRLERLRVNFPSSLQTCD